MKARWAQQVAEATECIAARSAIQPRVAIVLGSGLGELANAIQVDAVLPFASVPHLPRATALGHAGQFILGTIGDVGVVAMQGRAHLYEGYSTAEVTLPVGVMHALGARLLILSNASGGLNPAFRAGNLMLVEDHINLMHNRLPVIASAESDSSGRDTIYDRGLLTRTLEIARQCDVVVQVGVYIGLKGPNYETRAEYRFLRALGGDAVGMSTVPEATLGRRLGMQVLAFSTIANVALPDALIETTGDAVVAVSGSAAPRLLRLLELLIEDWAGRNRAP